MPNRMRPLNALAAAVALGVPLVLASTGVAAAAAPAAPDNVSCSPSGTGQIDVTTDSVWGVNSTEVRDALSGKVWTLSGDAVGAPYDATITGLRPSQRYRLQMRYTDDTGTSPWTAPCAPAYARPIVGNLVLNPSAEHGLAYWHGTDARLAAASGGSPGEGGATAIKVTRSAGTRYGLADSAAGDLPTVVSAKRGSYEAAAWVKAGSASAVGKPATIALREQSASGTLVRTTTGRQVLLSADWQQVWVTAPVQTAGDRIGIRVQQGKAAAGDAMDVDDVRVHPDGSLFSLGSAQNPQTAAADVTRLTAKDMTPCSQWAEFWVNCDLEHDLTRYGAYVDGRAGGSGSASVRGVIYADTGNGPGALIASTRSVVVKAGQAAGWVDLPLAAPVELGSRPYWFGYQVGGASNVLRLYGDDVSYCDCGYPNGVSGADAYADGPRSPFGAYQDSALNTMVKGSGGS